MMKIILLIVIIAFGIILITANYSFAVEEKKETAPEKPAHDDEKDTKGVERKQVQVAEGEIGSKGGEVATDDLLLNVEAAYDAKTFDRDAKISIHHLNNDPGLSSYEMIGPVWLIKSDTKYLKKAKYTFEYENENYPAGSVIAVLTWWRNNWIIAGIPEINNKNSTVTIEADYPGYFVPVRTKSRDEILIRKYRFPDDERRILDVIGFFRYRTKCRKGEELLEEEVDFREHFIGDVVFGPIGETERTGVKLLYADSIGDPSVLSFQGKVTLPKETIFATGHENPEQRGVITAKQERGILRFEGLPTIIGLTGLHGDKEIALPTMRGNLSLSGINFDWKFQEMFHLQNFIYSAELTMPHGTPDERTTLTLYLQFIVH